jgi:CxxC motif-containing protein (DUF1111 family)
MKLLKFLVVVLFAVTAIGVISASRHVKGQAVTEAPTGFDNLTNGMIDQVAFDTARAAFEERDTIEEGLGPVYNAQSCAECHQSPTTGGISQITVLRAGHRDRNDNFVEAPGGSLVQDRAIHPSLQEVITPDENITTFRTSLIVLGDGFVEAIADETLLEIARNQARQGGPIAGQAIQVPVLEAPGITRVGRFGWKNQHASLLSFSADAYLNEMGITNRLLRTENTSWGRSVAAFDLVPDIEDQEDDIELFTRFMRASKPLSRDVALANSIDGRAGAQLFNQIGCAVCHVPTIVTAPVGTSLAGGTFIVPPALGSKAIHPFSDFLLHDVGTGDGIVQNGGQATANKLRTPPLWGLRTRNRFMHDGLSLTLEDSIRRHRGTSTGSTNRFNVLTDRQRAQVIRFLRSL